MFKLPNSYLPWTIGESTSSKVKVLIESKVPDLLATLASDIIDLRLALASFERLVLSTVFVMLESGVAHEPGKYNNNTNFL